MAFRIGRCPVIHTLRIVMAAGRCTVVRSAISILMYVETVKVICRETADIRLHTDSFICLCKCNDTFSRVSFGWMNDRRSHLYVSCVVNCRSEEHTSELQSRGHLVCRLLLEIKK